MDETKWADSLLNKLIPPKPSTLFLISYIIPTLNSSEGLILTLESLKKQNCSSFEVIIVDAGSTDPTIELAISYGTMISKIYTVSEYHLYEMLNRGISFAKGEYIACLMPGTLFLSYMAVETMIDFTISENRPELVYCGSILREKGRSTRLHFTPFQRNDLKEGKEPGNLSAYLFRQEVFEKWGKFNGKYPLRASFDFLINLTRHKVKIAFLKRVFIDVDYIHFSFGKFFSYAKDTWLIIYHHFGLKRALYWLLGFNYLNFFKWGMKGIKHKFNRI